MRKLYREGQEDQLGALGLVVNIIVLWNTIYMNTALESLRDQSELIVPEDIVRLSPFGHRHINYLGHYNFNLPETLQDGKLRPFHALGYSSPEFDDEPSRRDVVTSEQKH